MRQIHPETGEYVFFFQNINPIVFVTLISLFFELLYAGSYGRNQENPLQNLKIANKIVFFLSPALFFYLMYQKGYQM